MRCILCNRRQIVLAVCVLTSLWYSCYVIANSNNGTATLSSLNFISSVISYGRRQDKNISTQTNDYFLSNNTNNNLHLVIDSRSYYGSEFLASNVEDRGRYVLVGLKRPFVERIQFYNDVVSVYRNRTLDKLRLSDAQQQQQQQQQWPVLATTIYSDVNNFLLLLATDSHVTVRDTLTTVYLTYMGPPLTSNSSDLDLHWDSRSAEMSVNVLMPNYYDWAGPAPLCQYVNHEECWHFFVEAARNCKNTGNSTLSTTHPSYTPTSMNSSLLRHQMIGGMADTVPYLTYVHIIRQATVRSNGHVFVADFKIVQPMCFSGETDYKVDLRDTPPPFNNNSVYDEVFVITQIYGNAYFHKNMENMPRLAPLLPFLKAHPHIRIHVDGGDLTNSLFRSLGLDPSRIVNGDIHARVVYLPRSTFCDQLQIAEGQLLSREYRLFIANSLLPLEDHSWNSVVLIRRTGSTRKLKLHDDIAVKVKTIAEKYGRRYELFADNPPPSVDQTMLVFYRARVIIAPHGAGLANMLFSRPGTFIIEGLSEAPATNPCFINAAHHLGHSHFGIPSRGGYIEYIDMDPNLVASTLEDILAHLQQTE